MELRNLLQNKYFKAALKFIGWVIGKAVLLVVIASICFGVIVVVDHNSVIPVHKSWLPLTNDGFEVAGVQIVEERETSVVLWWNGFYFELQNPILLQIDSRSVEDYGYESFLPTVMKGSVPYGDGYIPQECHFLAGTLKLEYHQGFRLTLPFIEKDGVKVPCTDGQFRSYPPFPSSD